MLKFLLKSGTRLCVNNLKKQQLNLPNYALFSCVDGVEVVCENNKLDFIMKTVREAKNALKKNNIIFSQYINLIIQTDEPFHQSYLDSCICINELEEWVDSEEGSVSKLITQIIYLTLISREFIENCNFSGSSVLKKNRLKSKELLVKAEFISPFSIKK